MLGRRLYSTAHTSSAVLKQALKLVPQEGWHAALLNTTRKDKLSDQSLSVYKPFDLVSYFYQTEIHNLAAHKLSTPETADAHTRLEELLLFRLKANTALGHDNLAEAIRIAREDSPLSPLKLINETCDELWFRAGDRSTDLTWYTRRGSLAAVYAACELIQSRDLSPNCTNTETFAKKLVKTLATGEYADKSFNEWLEYNVKGVFNVARTLL